MNQRRASEKRPTKVKTKAPSDEKALAVARRAKSSATETVKPEIAAQVLLGDIRVLIDQARTRVSQAVNAGMVSLYWHIGHRIRTALLNEKRAEYGQRVVGDLAERLTGEYGKGFTKANLFHMIQFAEVFADEQIVYALCRQLSWSHFREIIYLKDQLKRDFYAEMCRVERWSTRTLRAKINGMLYERTALAKKSEDEAKLNEAINLARKTAPKDEQTA